MKSKNVKILLLLTIILLLLFGIVYATTDIFKSPRTLFYKYLISGNVSNITEKDYDEFLNNINEQKPYEVLGDITFKYEDKKITNNFASAILENMKFNYNMQIDNKNKNRYVNIKANYNNNQVLNLELANNDMTIGIKEEDLQDKYISIDLSKLKETLEKLGIDTTEVYNASSYDMYNLYYISKEDRKTIYTTYKKILYTQIPTKDYSVKKNVEIEVNGNKYKCNAYTLKVTDEELNVLYRKMLEELKNDELTLNLIVEKYNMANMCEKDITKEELIRKIEKKIDELSLEGPKYETTAITVYENNSKTIRTEIINGEDIICVDSTKTKDNTLVLIKTNIDNTKDEILLSSEDKSENEKEYKIIYTQGSIKFKVNITSKISNMQSNIMKLNKDNSNNISEMTEEEIKRFNDEFMNSVNSFILKKLNIIGISNEMLQLFNIEEDNKTTIENDSQTLDNTDIQENLQIESEIL